jgi:hypothetical protein
MGEQNSQSMLLFSLVNLQDLLLSGKNFPPCLVSTAWFLPEGPKLYLANKEKSLEGTWGATGGLGRHLYLYLPPRITRLNESASSFSIISTVDNLLVDKARAMPPDGRVLRAWRTCYGRDRYTVRQTGRAQVGVRSAVRWVNTYVSPGPRW